MKKIITFVTIFIGASIGGSLRYLISQLFAGQTGFPWGTLFVNLTGAFILPLLIHYLHDRYHLSATTVLSLTTGLLGAYTTFSTMASDTYHLLNSGNHYLLAGYLLLTMVGGFGFAVLGNYVAAIRAQREYDRRQGR